MVSWLFNINYLILNVVALQSGIMMIIITLYNTEPHGETYTGMGQVLDYKHMLSSFMRCICI